MKIGQDLILVTGATGQQGGATARELLAAGHKVRAMTRKPDGGAARALAALGAEVVKGDLDDVASLERALKDAWGVFAVQNTWEAGVEGEELQGKRLAELARKAGVQHYVYASVGSAHRKTGIPHFDNKARVEATVRGLGFPSWTILRAVFFMENFTSPGFKSAIEQGQLAVGVAPTTKLQVTAVADIGKYGRIAFERHEALNGRAIDMAAAPPSVGSSPPLPTTRVSLACIRRCRYAPPIASAHRRSSSTATPTDTASIPNWCARSSTRSVLKSRWPPSTKPTSKPVPKHDIGVQGQFIGPDGDNGVRSAANLGVGWIKQQVDWISTEYARGLYQWDELDHLVPEAQKYGLKIMFSVARAPGFSRPEPVEEDGPPSDFAICRDFMHALSSPRREPHLTELNSLPRRDSATSVVRRTFLP